MSKMHPSLEGFADWLEKQSPEGAYNYDHCRNCASAQYHKSLGIEYDIEVSVARGLEDIAEAEPNTFGACARRARFVVENLD